MKNIDKYKTPQDKIEAWKDWCCSKKGCYKCVKTLGYLDRYVHKSRGCDKEDMCFNAWLHSTTETNKTKKEGVK